MRERYKYGIGFWAGGAVLSLINMWLNVRNAAQSEVLNYNYLMIGISVLGLILNWVLLLKSR